MVFGKVKATIDAEAAVKLMARFNGELDGAVEYIARVLNIWPLPQTQDTNKVDWGCLYVSIQKMTC